MVLCSVKIACKNVDINVDQVKDDNQWVENIKLEVTHIKQQISEIYQQ